MDQQDLLSKEIIHEVNHAQVFFRYVTLSRIPPEMHSWEEHTVICAIHKFSQSFPAEMFMISAAQFSTGNCFHGAVAVFTGSQSHTLHSPHTKASLEIGGAHWMKKFIDCLNQPIDTSATNTRRQQPNLGHNPAPISMSVSCHLIIECSHSYLVAHDTWIFSFLRSFLTSQNPIKKLDLVLQFPLFNEGCSQILVPALGKAWSLLFLFCLTRGNLVCVGGLPF